MAAGNPVEILEYNEEVEYKSIDFSNYELADYTFDNCQFISCKFNELSLHSSAFSSCCFKGCELVLTSLINTRLTDVTFIASKIMGIDFSVCNDFGLSFEFRESIMDSIVIFGKKLRKTKMIECQIKNSDFTDMDFKEADFSKSTFENVVFHNCQLEKADFRSSQGYAIDPGTNRLKNARFSLPEAQSFLGFLGIKIE